MGKFWALQFIDFRKGVEVFERPNAQVKSLIVAAFLLPTMVLLGWLSNQEILRSLIPTYTPMNPLTAGVFLALTGALLLFQRKGLARYAVGMTAAVLLLCLWVAASYVSGWSFRPDAWLFADQVNAGEVKNRMAPNTITCFVLIALSLFALKVRGEWGAKVAQGLAFVAASVGGAVLFGYALSAGAVQTFGYSLPMAFVTAINFIVVATIILSLRCREGFLYPFYGRTPASAFARRMLLTGVTVPIIVTTLRVTGERLGHLPNLLGSAVGAIISILIFVLLIWRASYALKRAEEERDAMHEGLTLRAVELEVARKEADRANLAKSEFLSRMSHELRTPMNAVLGYAQLMEMRATDEETQESSQAIIKGGRHLLDLINEVLDTARIEAGKLQLSLEPIALEGLIEHTIELVLPTAESQRLTVEFEGRLQEKVYVLADRQRLIQILLNLLSNAIKFNRPGGKVTFSCEVVEEGRVRVCVGDTGTGIPAGREDELFKPFERLGHDLVEGTGLGLALSKNLAELMGGKLYLIETGPGGSVFGLDLQIAEPPVAYAAVEQAVDLKSFAESEAGVVRIVYIEDNLSNLELLEKVSARMGGIELLSAIQGSVGLDLVRSQVPHMVLLDLHLPDMHGSDVLRELKADPATQDIPVVVLSADATDTQIKRLLDLGAKAYLTKPIDLTKLFAEINALKSELEAP